MSRPLLIPEKNWVKVPSKLHKECTILGFEQNHGAYYAWLAKPTQWDAFQLFQKYQSSTGRGCHTAAVRVLTAAINELQKPDPMYLNPTHKNFDEWSNLDHKVFYIATIVRSNSVIGGKWEGENDWPRLAQAALASFTFMKFIRLNKERSGWKAIMEARQHEEQPTSDEGSDDEAIEEEESEDGDSEDEVSEDEASEDEASEDEQAGFNKEDSESDENSDSERETENGAEIRPSARHINKKGRAGKSKADRQKTPAGFRFEPQTFILLVLVLIFLVLVLILWVLWFSYKDHMVDMVSHVSEEVVSQEVASQEVGGKDLAGWFHFL